MIGRAVPRRAGTLRRLLAGAALSLAVGAVSAMDGAADAHRHAAKRSPHTEPQRIAEEQLGVEIVALRPTAADRMLDLRVRVIDPDKALKLLGKKGGHGLYLVDSKTGKALGVPSTKVGTLRQTSVRPTPGKVYFLLFANFGAVRPGDEVTLVAGGARVPGIVVGSHKRPPTTEPDSPDAPETEAPLPAGSSGMSPRP